MSALPCVSGVGIHVIPNLPPCQRPNVLAPLVGPVPADCQAKRLVERQQRPPADFRPRPGAVQLEEGRLVRRVPGWIDADRRPVAPQRPRRLGDAQHRRLGRRVGAEVPGPGEPRRFLAQTLCQQQVACQAVENVLKKPGTADLLKEIAVALSACEPFDAATTEKALHVYAESKGIKAGSLNQPLRVAVTGVSKGPGVFETLSIFGKVEVLRRIGLALAIA